jgi:hypothetical protein
VLEGLLRRLKAEGKAAFSHFSDFVPSGLLLRLHAGAGKTLRMEMSLLRGWGTSLLRSWERPSSSGAQWNTEVMSPGRAISFSATGSACGRENPIPISPEGAISIFNAESGKCSKESSLMAREHYFLKKIWTFFLHFSKRNVAKSDITKHIYAPFQKSSDECEIHQSN